MMSARTAMRMLVTTSILTYLAAVIMANDISIAIVITVSVVCALMTGWSYIQAVKPVVEPAIVAGKINLDTPL
jgi:hypothetical protein